MLVYTFEGTEIRGQGLQTKAINIGPHKQWLFHSI